MVFVSILMDRCFIFIGPQHEKLMGLQVNNHMFHVYWSKFQFSLAPSLMIQIGPQHEKLRGIGPSFNLL